MRRVSYEVHLEVDVPDGAPDPVLDLQIVEGVLHAAVRDAGTDAVLPVEQADGAEAPTRDDREDALDAAMALLPPEALSEVEAELDRVERGSKGKVRGRWVQRVYVPNTRQYDFAVYEGALPGVTESRREAAVRILRDEQRRKMGGA